MYTDEQKYGLITKPEPEKISRYDLINKPEPDELYHWGVKGMKWGVRRYQNKDGSLTPEGQARLRKQWMTDPKMFVKHYDDLTEDERQYALKRRRDIQQFVDTKPRPAPQKHPIQDAAKTAAALTAIGVFGAKGISWLKSPSGKKVVGTGKEWVGKAWKWATTDQLSKRAAKKAMKTGTAIVPRIIHL